MTVGFVLTAAYDAVFSGASASTGSILDITGSIPGLELFELIPITSLFVAVGSAVASDGRTSRTAIGGAIGVLVIVFVRFLPTHPLPVLILTAYTAAGGAPWTWLVYRLTRPPDRRHPE